MCVHGRFSKIQSQIKNQSINQLSNLRFLEKCERRLINILNKFLVTPMFTKGFCSETFKVIDSSLKVDRFELLMNWNMIVSFCGIYRDI